MHTISGALALTGLLAMAAPALAGTTAPPLTNTPFVADCGEGARPETGLQGQVSQDDHDSGRAAEGFTCNTELVGSHRTLPAPTSTFGSIGGFKVHRYVDAAGNECAYYDSTLLFPTNIGDAEGGVIVLDMADPANPVQTFRMTSPAMLQPHESLVISEERGIIAAMTSTLATNPGTLDVWDISGDCRRPVPMTSWTTMTDAGVPLLGHESGLTLDGRFFWVASTATDYLFVVDISEEVNGIIIPRVVHVDQSGSHGINFNDDGTRAYLSNSSGILKILDTSQIVEGVADPQTPLISELRWPDTSSIPQNSNPFTNSETGRSYLFEVDEFGSCAQVGAARVIDITDETAPFVAANVRLEVNNEEHFDAVCDDPGTGTPVIQGYAGHYCNIPTRVDPTIAACSFIVSGLRIFDITDPEHPVEVAYFNAPVMDRPAFDAVAPGTMGAFEASNWAMSAPAFVPERKEIWYSDGFQGFYAVRVTNDVWPDTLADGIHEREDEPVILTSSEDRGTATASLDGTLQDGAATGSTAGAPDAGGADGTLAATGGGAALLGLALLGAAGAVATRRRRDG